MDPAGWNVVGDLPGGTRQAMFGWAKYADVLALVVEPTPKSIQGARRLQNISRAEWSPRHIVVVANRVTGSEDVQGIEQALDCPMIGAVPDDHAVMTADKEAAAPLDVGSGPFVDAVEELVATVESSYDAEH